MGFREPLDVGKYLGQYQEFLGHSSTSEIGYVLPEKPQEQPAYEPIPQALYAPRIDVERPALTGEGPPVCSASLRVAQARPVLAWDPNRYYRDLGIEWPYVHATRADLRRAYYAMNGSSSTRLTYCVKQLLNLQVRAEYDALPLGERYLNDMYVQEELRANAAAEASRRSQRGSVTAAQDVLDEWGYKLVPDDTPDTDLEVVDTDRFNRFDEDSHQGPDGAADWGYSYFLWRTYRRDCARLAAWQSALISVLGRQENPPALAVGLVGSREPNEYVIGQVDNTWVAFLNDKCQVDPDLVLAAANALQREIDESAQ